MKPLNLYTKTTLLVSAVLTAVLLAVVYFFFSATRDIERRQQENLARQWVEQLANRLSNSLEPRNYAQLFMDVHDGEIQQIRIYETVKKMTLHEWFSLPQREKDEVIPDASLALLRKGQTVSRTYLVGTGLRKLRVIYAAAPLTDDNKKLSGVVSLTIQRQNFSDLSVLLMKLTIALLAAAVISITALLYFLFSQVIYLPVTDLLQTMTQVKSGNLDVAVPMRARDEFGKLATDFNHMVSRLRVMTSEREAYQKSLEERVQEKTVELADRNAALFEMQRELTKFERLAVAGQLAAQFAHEVGTPLNLISGHVQLLAAKTDEPKTKERLDLIGSQIARIERIVRNMLDATKRPRPELSALDINALLRRIFELTAPTLAAHQVELITALDELNPSIQGDSEQLQQVFINLINNSLDAMPRGGQLAFTTDLITNAEGHHQARIICRDTGTGISAEVRGRIFDPLFTTRLGERGSGFGLAVVHQIIREHGGTITLESPPGTGAEFQITLPLATDQMISAKWPVVSENPAPDTALETKGSEHQPMAFTDH